MTKRAPRPFSDFRFARLHKQWTAICQKDTSHPSTCSISCSGFMGLPAARCFSPRLSKYPLSDEVTTALCQQSGPLRGVETYYPETKTPKLRSPQPRSSFSARIAMKARIVNHRSGWSRGPPLLTRHFPRSFVTHLSWKSIAYRIEMFKWGSHSIYPPVAPYNNRGSSLPSLSPFPHPFQSTFMLHGYQLKTDGQFATMPQSREAIFHWIPDTIGSLCNN